MTLLRTLNLTVWYSYNMSTIVGVERKNLGTQEENCSLPNGCYELQRNALISCSSLSVKPGISRWSERSSERIPILHSSVLGTGKYFIEFFILLAVKESWEQEHSREILLRVLPITVVMSSRKQPARILMEYFGLEERDLTNPEKRLASITFGCRDPEIPSIRYRWVVFGTCQAWRTDTFQAV